MANFPSEGFTAPLQFGEGENSPHPSTAFPPPTDVNPPTIVNFVPPNGSVIERTQAIQFDVIDDSGTTRRTFVWASYPGTPITVQELIWDGEGFTSDYAAFSTRVVITGGHRFVARRRTGWPASVVTMHVVAIDPSGGVSA